MEKRKRVDIDEAEIIRMMAADIPTSVMVSHSGEQKSRPVGEDKSETASLAPDESAQTEKPTPEIGRAHV